MNTQFGRRSRAVVLVGAMLVVWAGCREEDPLGEDANRAPETYLIESPRWDTAGFYINHLFWDGYDPDGRVDHFEVTVTDSFGVLDEAIWHPTFRTDSLVRFPVGGESGQDQVLGNRFYVRAVDNLGRRDPQPAWIFFLAIDQQFPEVVFRRAEGRSDAYPGFGVVPLGQPRFCDRGVPADTLPTESDVTFLWTGVDRDSILGAQVGSVTAFEYKLSRRNNQFLGGSITDTLATYQDLAPGVYTFTVRTTDDGGLQSQGCRYFQVNYDPTTRIERVWNSCIGDSVVAARVGTNRWFDRADPCQGVEPWSYTSDFLPAPPTNPCLPPGFLAADDTLRVSAAAGTGWWFEFDLETFDRDGEVDRLEINLMECSPLSGNCSPRAWKCAALDSDGTAVVGPFTSGDWRVVIAAVDALGQRGASEADTIDFRVDLKPFFVTRTDGMDMDVCDGFAAGVTDTFQICDNDTMYVVRSVQGDLNNDAPCAVETEYADGSGTAPVTVYDYNSFPRDGDVVQLEFRTDSGGQRFARFCGLAWGRDKDGTGRIGYARWSLDQIPTGPWGTIDPAVTALADSTELTPVCFCAVVRQQVPVREHTLYIEFRDWLQTDAPAGVRVAQRTVREEITFTVEDISTLANRRYTLPGRDER